MISARNSSQRTFEVATWAANRGTLRLSSRAAATVDVVAVVRPIERGAVLKAADMLVERHPRAEVIREIVTDRDQPRWLRRPRQPAAGRCAPPN